MSDNGVSQLENEVEVTYSDLQQDTDNPLSSVKNFAELNIAKEIQEGLIAMNFRKPSKVQERALPLLLANPPRNMIAQSQSGTGKTAAFVIAVLSRIDYTQPHRPQALILAPTRELARQIEDVVKQIGQFVPDLYVQAAVPGAIDRATGVRASVVVGTPGTVMDSIRRRQFDIQLVSMLVVDEADNMLDQTGLGEQAAKVKTLLSPNCQVLLFSATFPDKVKSYAKRFAPNAHSMLLKREDEPVKGISQMYMDCPSEQDKYDVLVKMYSMLTVGSSVIFVKTRESASIIEQRMKADGHQISALHGAFDGNERDRLLQEFRAGKSKVLITTNVMARGIDVSTVNMVINYDIPMRGFNDAEPDPETYIHRIGRTGRFGRQGVSITFVFDKKSFAALQQISEMYTLDLVQLTPDDWDRTERKISEVIKSNRAKADYKPGATEGDAEASAPPSVQPEPAAPVTAED